MDYPSPRGNALGQKIPPLLEKAKWATDNLVVTSFKAPKDLIEVVDKLARYYGVTRSTVIRAALMYYIGYVNEYEYDRITYKKVVLES